MKKFLLVFIFFNGIMLAQIKSEIIKPIALTTGKTDSILISDLFYSKNYNVSFDIIASVIC